MKRVKVLPVATIAAIAIATQPGLAAQSCSAHISDAAVTHLIHWHSYWKGNLRNYVAGKRVPGIILCSTRRMDLILAEVGVSLTFEIQADGSLRALGTGVIAPGETNESTAQKYLYYQSLGSRVSPRLKRLADRFERRGGESAERSSQPEVLREQYTQEAVEFELPAQGGPDAIRLKKAAPELRDLAAAMVDELRIYLGPECPGRPRAVIPYFSPDDPLVYIFAEVCGGEGIYMAVLRSGGKWEVGQFFINRAPRDVRETIRKVRETAVLTLELQ